MGRFIEPLGGADPECIFGNEGFEAFKQYIEENIQYPAVETTADRVVVVMRFTLKPNGEISDIETLRSPGQSFTAEATRLIMEVPSWNPAFTASGIN